MSNDTKVRLVAEITAQSKGLVDALKQASSAVNSTTGNWKSQFSSLKDATNTIGASVRNLSQLVKEVGNVDMNITGMEEIGKAISSVRGSFDGVKADVDAFVASLSIMKSEAQQFGMPMEEFGRFSEAVKASGVSMSDALQMVKAMQEQIQALANGVPEAQATFDKLGLTIEQLSSNTVSANFEAISQAINSTISPSERATQNMNLFKSSIDKTMAVAQEYNKTISKQQGSYATDKDVQNATQLQSALTKLGEQLNGYSDKAREATTSTEKMTSAEQLDMMTLQSAIDAQQKYNSSLDSTISTLSGVTSAYARLQESIGNTDVFDISKFADGEGLSESIRTANQLLDEETQKMSQIVDIQTRLGAPIDMQYINTYKKHVEQLLEAYKRMQSMFKIDILENLTGDPSKLENLKEGYENLKNNIQGLQKTLESATDTQKKFEEHNRIYYDTKSAQESIDAFKIKVNEAWDKLSQGVAPRIDTGSIDEASAKIERLKQETDEKVEKQIAVNITGFEDVHDKLQSVKGEIDKLNGMYLNIDTSSLDEAIQSANELKGSVESLHGSGTGEKHIESITGIANALTDVRTQIEGVNEGVNAVSVNKVAELRQEYDDINAIIETLATSEATSNDELQRMEGIANEVSERIEYLKINLDSISQNHKIDIDTSKLEDALRTVRKLEKESHKVNVDATEVNRLNDLFHEARSNVQAINQEVQKGIPRWQPVINAVNRFRTYLKQCEHPIRDTLKRGWNAIGDAVSSATNKLTHFRHKTEESSKSTQTIGSVLKQATGQIFGMGSAVAVVVKMWRMATEVVKEYVKQLQEAHMESMYGNSFNAMQGVSEKRSEQEQRFNDVLGKLKELASTYDEAEKGNREAVNKVFSMRDNLQKLYGIDIKSDGAGKIVELDRQIVQVIKQFKEDTLTAINGNIDVANNVIQGTSKFIKDYGYWRQVGATFTGDLAGKEALRDAKDKNTQATNEKVTLMGSKWRIEHIDYARDFLWERQGKKQQENKENSEKARENARKEKQERAKKLQEGTQKLKDWENSLTDNNRQKEYRSIMAKYNEAIEAGVKEEDARRVATQAITALLKQEEAEEKKKNQELLDAVQKRIEAYKQTYQHYLDAEKSLVDAKKKYADAQNDLAREAKAERIQNRRDAIARRLRTFGFTLPENFDMQESNRQRIARRRNRKTDNFIGEKLVQWEEGRRVRWTKAERERLGEYQALQNKDKQLEAIQKQMDAAQQTENAAERLASAADSVRDAALKFQDARDELVKARNEMNDAMDKKQRTHTNEADPKDIFDELKKGNYAGVKEPKQRYKYDYSDLDEKVRDDEKKMRRRQEKDIEFDEGIEDVVKKAKKRDKRETPDSIENEFDDDEVETVTKKAKKRDKRETPDSIENEFDDDEVETVTRKKKKDERERGLRIYGKPDSAEKGRGLRIGGVSTQLKKGEGLRIPRSDSRGLVTRQQLKGLKAPGVNALQPKQINYHDSLTQIHKDLVEMARKTYRVR